MALRLSLSETCGFSLRFMQYMAGRSSSSIFGPQLRFNRASTAVVSSIFNNENNQNFLSSKKFCHTKIINSLQPINTSIVQQTQSIVDAEEKVEYDKLYRSIRVECRGNDMAVLKSYSQFVSLTAKHLEINMVSIKVPRYYVRRWTVLKSVFVHKKHRVQYEARTHFVIMLFLRLTSSTADTFLEYIQRNLPEGVAMIVSKQELCYLPKYVIGSDKVAAHPVT